MADLKEKLKESLYFPTAVYFSLFAKILIILNHKKVVVVTGSSGKTGAITLMNNVLHEATIPYRFHDHINSAHGIPMSILGIDTKDTVKIDQNRYLIWLKRIGFTPYFVTKSLFHKDSQAKYYVFEEDSDRPGEIKLSSWLLEPSVVIWLNVGLTHAYFHEKKVTKNPNLTMLESIADDYAYSIKNMAKNGIAIINIDDQMIYTLRKQAKGHTLEIGKKSKYIQLNSYELDGLNTKFIVTINTDKIEKDLWMSSFNKKILGEWDGLQTFIIPNNLIPEYFYYTIASICVFAIIQNISLLSFNKAVKSYKLPPGRMNIFEGINKSYIIDSSYNAADANAMIGAIELLAEFEKTVAILGDMREQGSLTQAEHERIAEKILSKHLNVVILVGEAMCHYAFNYLIEHGFNRDNLYTFKNTIDLKNELLTNNFKLIPSNAIILVKGSQNQIFLESIVAILLKDKSKTSELCRRGEAWGRRRAALGL